MPEIQHIYCTQSPSVSFPTPPVKKIVKYSWMTRYIVRETVGQGNYGKVKLGIDTQTGEEVALKVTVSESK